MYKTLILLLFSLSIITPSYAAFPINSNKTTEANTHPIYQYQTSQYETPAAPHPFGYRKGKNHTVALLLSLFGGFLGAHRFYLGYYWHGAIYLLVTAIIVFAVVSTMATSAWILGLLVASALLPPFGFWVFIDFVRICTKTLLPKDGNYN